MSTTTAAEQDPRERMRALIASRTTRQLVGDWTHALHAFYAIPLDQSGAPYLLTLEMIAAELARRGETLCDDCGGPAGRHDAKTCQITASAQS